MMLCGNLIGMRCAFHTDISAKIDKTAGCGLYDDQSNVLSYDITAPITSFSYFLHEGTTVKTWQTSNLNCYGEQFTAVYKKGGSSITKPNFIVF